MSEWTDPRYTELVAAYRRAAEDAQQAEPDEDQNGGPVRAFLTVLPAS